MRTFVKHILVLMVLSIFVVMGTSGAWAIVVANTDDSGAGSLRQAILDANGDFVPTPITFDPTVFPGTINLVTELPSLTDPGDTIDGTDNGVVIDGSALVGNRDGLRVRASNITIRGLTIQNFPRDGIRIRPDGSPASGKTVTGVVISENFLRNNLDGLRISGRDDTNVVSAIIASNIFEGNNDDGILVRGSSNTGAGGNTVNVVINNNEITGSLGTVLPTISGDGIRVTGGRGTNGGGNLVTVTISNNDIRDNADNAILVRTSGGDGGSSSNNVVHAEIVGNRATNSGLAGNATAIIVSGGVRSSVSSTASKNNEMTFLVSNNSIDGSTSHGISITGGNGDLAGSNNTVSGTVSNNVVMGSDGRGINVTGGLVTHLHTLISKITP